MAVQEILHSITENLQNSATVKKVYGDPIAAEGKTIIPVARVKYGFGAGGGSNKPKKSEDGNPSNAEEGGGGGGGVAVVPLRYIEVAGKHSEFIPISDKKKTAGLIAGGLVLGLLAGAILKKKKWFR